MWTDVHTKMIAKIVPRKANEALPRAAAELARSAVRGPQDADRDQAADDRRPVMRSRRNLVRRRVGLDLPRIPVPCRRSASGRRPAAPDASGASLSESSISSTLPQAHIVTGAKGTEAPPCGDFAKTVGPLLDRFGPLGPPPPEPFQLTIGIEVPGVTGCVGLIEHRGRQPDRGEELAVAGRRTPWKSPRCGPAPAPAPGGRGTRASASGARRQVLLAEQEHPSRRRLDHERARARDRTACANTSIPSAGANSRSNQRSGVRTHPSPSRASVSAPVGGVVAAAARAGHCRGRTPRPPGRSAPARS